MSFTQVFGGNTIYPSDPTYLALALTADVQLQWPVDQNVTGLTILAAILEVTPNAPGHSLLFPDARVGSTGYVTTFFNAGASTFTVKDHTGATVLTVASGEAWNVYLRDNTTEGGLWRIFQMGAGTSTANAATLAGAGLVAISTTLNENMATSNHALSYAIVNGDRAIVQAWTGASGAFTLPDATVVGAGWFVPIKNNGSGSVTIQPTGGQTIDGAASILLATLESTFVISDGINFYTIGFGQENASAFDFLSMSVAGTGDLTLTGAQLNRVSYEFTGVLTGNRNIIVPAAVQQYWVFNNTTGAFTLTLKATGGDPGVVVPQGTRMILYCNGTNVVNAETNTASLPAVVQGDILYGAGPGTLAALGKNATPTRYLSNTGASNNPAWAQVDLTNGVTGVLPVANGGATPFSAATVTKSADQGIADNAATLVTWNQESLDDGGWHDNVTNNSRLTTPSGVTRARFFGTLTLGLAGASTPFITQIAVLKNGAGGPVFNSFNMNTITAGGVGGERAFSLPFDSGWLAVTAGDYFEVQVLIDGNAAGGTVYSSSSQSHFCVEGH